jgi:hypothetical protein
MWDHAQRLWELQGGDGFLPGSEPGTALMELEDLVQGQIENFDEPGPALMELKGLVQGQTENVDGAWTHETEEESEEPDETRAGGWPKGKAK